MSTTTESIESGRYILFPEKGLTDPHAMVVDDRLYLLCTRP